MMEISLFLSFIGFSIIMGIVGIWIRIPMLMLVGGAMITFLSVIPLDFNDGSRVSNITESGSTNIVQWENEPVVFDVYPKILFAVMGSIFMLGGAMMWKYQD